VNINAGATHSRPHLTAATIVVLAIFVSVNPTRAQAPNSFEVASVLREDAPRNYVRTQVIGTRFVAEGATAAILIRYAYDLKNFQLAGGPEWLYDRETQFNVRATFSGDPSAERVRAMVRALLADRFALKVHTDRKAGSIFELAVAGGGAKLTVTKGDNPSRRGCSPYPTACTDVSMSDFADYLSDIVLSEVVVNKTGLDGRYDVTVSWSPDSSQFRGNGGRGFFSGDGPSLFTALQEQAGLQLRATKGDVPIVVVETIAAPAAN
jgi:uncharacterized protein (TIGR03435 family)